MKPVLNKFIHTDQKRFIEGRNISENNRKIDDIIDNEEKEDVIIYVDQQKAFDRMECGWLNYVMECFNFGLKFREWVYMLFKNGKTCIKTNGFISKFFTISRSARQGCPAAPILYIIQAETMACAI
jgi:transposase-like protein